MKLNLISNIKNTIYELTHELSNDYRLPISIIKENLENLKIGLGTI